MPTDPADAFVWSFLPNWRQPFRVTREYRTDVAKSRSGKEQRRSLRTTPRRAFDYQTVAQDDRRRDLSGLLVHAQNKPFIMPDWSRRAALASSVAETGTVLALDSEPSWIVAGRALFLFDGVTLTAVFVDSIAGTDVTLTAPLDQAWGAGTVVLPGPVGLLANDVRMRSITDSLATVAVRFDVEPASEPEEAPAAASTSFNGREVCLLQPNWGDGLDNTYIWPPERVDFGRGAISYCMPVDFPSRLRRASFVAANVTEARAIDDLFDRMKGQRGEFYLPTGENDLPPAAALTSGTATLRVAGTGTADYYAGSTVFKAICVTLVDGTRLFRTVTSIATDAGDSVITCGSNWSSTIAADAVRLISWMPVWRFASDSLTTEWTTDSVAQADLTLRMLEDLTAEAA